MRRRSPCLPSTVRLELMTLPVLCPSQQVPLTIWFIQYCFYSCERKYKNVALANCDIGDSKSCCLLILGASVGELHYRRRIILSSKSQFWVKKGWCLVSQNTTAFLYIIGFYPHMPIGKVWTLLTVCLFDYLFVCLFVCLYGYWFLRQGIKFFLAVHRRPMQAISHFSELCSPRSPKLDESASARATPTRM